MKKRKTLVLLSSVVMVLLITSVMLFAGCDDKNSSFTGSYKSVWVDQGVKSETGLLRYELQIKKSGEVILNGHTQGSKKIFDEDGVTLLRIEYPIKDWKCEGVWKQLSSTELVCLMDAYDFETEKYMKTYFTLKKATDGTLIAQPSMAPAQNSQYYPGFQNGWGYSVTLIAFDKV